MLSMQFIINNVAQTSKGLPPKAQKDIQRCLSLCITKKYQMAETELKKILKKFGDESMLVKQMAYFLQILLQKPTHELAMEKLMEFYEEQKGIPDGILCHLFAVEAFFHYGHYDKAAKVAKHLCEVYSNATTLQYYLECLIPLLDFCEMAKIAVKLLWLDKSEIPKTQYSISLFFLAASKTTEKDREAGFEFAWKITQTLFKGNEAYLFSYKRMMQKEMERFSGGELKNVRIIPAGFFPEKEVAIVGEEFVVLPSHSGTSFIDFEGNTVEAVKKFLEMFQKKSDEKSPLETDATNDMEKEIEQKIESGEIDDEEKTLQISEYFQKLCKNDAELSILQLCRCIQFLNKFKPNHNTCGTLPKRIEEYFRRFGDQCHPIGYDYNLKIFKTLKIDDQKNILENNEKVLKLLQKYVHKKKKEIPEIGIEAETFLASCERSIKIDPEDEELWGILKLSKNLDEVTGKYYCRSLINSELKQYVFPSSTVQELEAEVSEWEKVLQILHQWKPTPDKTDAPLLNLMKEIILLCSSNLCRLHYISGNTMYIEILTCFLQKNYSAFDIEVDVRWMESFMHNCGIELGFGNLIKHVFTEYFGGQFSSQIIVGLKIFILESMGLFKDALDQYANVGVERVQDFNVTLRLLTRQFKSGRIEEIGNTISLIEQNLNLLLSARYFSRKIFLDAIFFKNYNNLPSKTSFDSFFKESWPNVLPGRFLENYPTFQQGFNECQLIRILCHFLILFCDYEAGNFEEYKDFLEDVEFYCQIISDKQSDMDIDAACRGKESRAFTIPALFVNAVNRPFLNLIKFFVPPLITVLSQGNSKETEKILETLPALSKFREFFDEMHATLARPFCRKFNYPHRIQTLADAVKMMQYFAKLLSLSFQAIVKLLNTDAKTMAKNKKFKPIFLHFRQYALELQLCMESVVTLAKKMEERWKIRKSLSSESGFKEFVGNVESFDRARISEYKESLSNLMKFSKFDSLIQDGLLKA